MTQENRPLIVVLESDASERSLTRFAEGLGLNVLSQVPRPVDPLPCQAVLFDMSRGAGDAHGHPRLRPWRNTATRWTVVAGADGDPAASPGPPYPFALSAREALRQLTASEADQLALYAREPERYAADTGEPVEHFHRRLGRRRRDDGDADWLGRWQRGLSALGSPHRVRDLGELTLVWVPEDVDLELGLELARCVQRTRHRLLDAGVALSSRPLLLLQHVGAEPPSADASDPRRGVLHARLLAHSPDLIDGLDGWQPLAGPAHFNHGWNWHPAVAVGDAEARCRALDRDLSALFARLLDAERPLRHYGCTLLFPFDPDALLHPDGERDAPNTFEQVLQDRAADPEVPVATKDYPQVCTGTDPCADQARLYFLPQLRAILYDTEQRADDRTLSPIQEWELTDTQGWCLELQADDRCADWIGTPVTAVRLYRYFNGIFLLGLRVALPEPDGDLAPLADDCAHWWHPLAFADPTAVRARSLAARLGFTRLARVIYPSFIEQHEEGKLAAEVRLTDTAGATLSRWRPYRRPGQTETALLTEPGAALSNVLRFLLTRFFGDGPFGEYEDLERFFDAYPHLDDDRLFVNVAYGLAGPAPAPSERGERLRRLFSLALFVDRPGADTFADCGDHAYDRTWLKAALTRASLGLWEETGLYAGFTDMSNAYLAHGRFFCTIAAPRHVPYMYERMLIMALFYRASLRRCSRQVADATRLLTDKGKDVTAGRDRFRALRKQFIRFTNRYWFHQVTAQMQGEQLFRQQQQALDLEREYGLIKDEMERAHEFLEAQRESRMADLATKAGWIGLFVAVAALWIALLPLVAMDGGIGPLSESLAHWRHLIGRAIGLLLLGLLPPTVLFFAGLGLWRWWSGRAS